MREYLLFLTNVKSVARGTHTIALCGIRFFFEATLHRDWEIFHVARPGYDKRLPVVPSRSEVWRILDCVRIPVYHACLTTIYACGSRLTEGATLPIPKVDDARSLPEARRNALGGHYFVVLTPPDPLQSSTPRICPLCGPGKMVILEFFPRQRAAPPRAGTCSCLPLPRRPAVGSLNTSL